MPPTTDQPLRRWRSDGAGFDVRRTLPVVLTRAAHPRQALLTTAVLAGGRDGRPLLEEVGLVAATVLVGQVILGWHNDVVDEQRDRDHARDDKPIALGHLERGTVTYAIAVAVLLLVPLSVANGIEAGLTHLAIVVVALLTNAGMLRRSRFSYLPWMATYGLFPAFLSYGGWAGRAPAGHPRSRSPCSRHCSASACTCCARCPAWSTTTWTG